MPSSSARSSVKSILRKDSVAGSNTHSNKRVSFSSIVCWAIQDQLGVPTKRWNKRISYSSPAYWQAQQQLQEAKDDADNEGIVGPDSRSSKCFDG